MRHLLRCVKCGLVPSLVADVLCLSLMLVFPEPPQWVSEPESQLSMIGSDVLINCSATGTPQPTIQWMVNGKPIEGMFSVYLNKTCISRTFYWCTVNGFHCLLQRSQHLTEKSLMTKLSCTKPTRLTVPSTNVRPPTDMEPC